MFANVFKMETNDEPEIESKESFPWPVEKSAEVGGGENAASHLLKSEVMDVDSQDDKLQSYINQEDRQLLECSVQTVNQSTSVAHHESDDAVNQSTTEAGQESEDAVNLSTAGGQEVKDGVNQSTEEASKKSEGGVNHITSGAGQDSEDAVDESMTGACQESENAVDHSMTGVCQVHEDAVTQLPPGSCQSQDSEDGVNEFTSGACQESEDAVNQSVTGACQESEDAVNEFTSGPCQGPEDAVNQSITGACQESEDAVDQFTSGACRESEDAVNQSVAEACQESEDAVNPLTSGASQESEDPVNQFTVEEGVDQSRESEVAAEKNSSPEDSGGRGDEAEESQGESRGESPEVEGGLLAAQPSEAELIAALRRHCCWVCGATASSHDANISHMLTHLQGVSNSNSVTATSNECSMLTTLPSLFLPNPTFGMDSTASADFLASMDTGSPFMLEDDCQSFMEAPVLDVPPPISRRSSSSMPSLLPLRLLDDSLRGALRDRSPGSSLPSPLTAVDENANMPTEKPDYVDVADALVCAVCLRTFTDRDDLVRHVEAEVRSLGLQAKRGRKPKAKTTSAKTKTPVKPVSKSPVKPSAKNTAPVKLAGKTTAPVKHDTRKPDGHVCSHCRRTFSRRIALRAHVAAAHPNRTKSKQSKTKMDDRPHLCTLCHKRFRRRAHLEQHRLVHSGERPFACAQCGVAFRRKDRLVVHVRTHLHPGLTRSGSDFKKDLVANSKTEAAPSSPAKTIPQSSVSTRSKTSSEAVAKAMKVGAVLEAKVSALTKAAAAAATEARAYKCATCSASYPLKGRLKRHVLKTHASTMPHVCLTCGKDCATRKRLAAHLEQHAEEKGPQRGAPVPGDSSAVTEDAVVEAVAQDTVVEAVAKDAAMEVGDSIVVHSDKNNSPIKSPSKIVFKIVSKNSSKDSHGTSVATRFLPKLAAEFAANMRQNDSVKAGAKVVYMVMTKPKSGEGEVCDESAAKPANASKVVFRVVPKPSPVKTPVPKVGFHVVPRVVPMGKVSGVMPLAAARRASVDSPAPEAPPLCRPRSTRRASRDTPPPPPPVREPSPPSTSSAPSSQPSRPPRATLKGEAAARTPSTPVRSSPRNRSSTLPQADGRFLCKKCGRRFVAEKLYLLHLQAHANVKVVKVVKTYECQCCGKKFLDRDVLRSHISTHL